jgi:N utilization substance protein B
VNDKARFIKKRKHARDKALQALYQWQLSGEDLDWIRDHYLQEQGVASGDEEYFLELLYQIPPQAEALDARYRNYVTNFEDHLDPIETNILRIASDQPGQDLWRGRQPQVRQRGARSVMSGVT